MPDELKDTGGVEDKSSDAEGNAIAPVSDVVRVTEYQPAPGWAPVTGTGREWEVTIIGAKSLGDVVNHQGRGYIPSKNGRLYAEEALMASVPMWEGVKVYDNHLTDAEFAERQGMRSVASEWLGTIINPRYEAESHRLVGTLKVVDEGLAKKLLAAHEQGVLSSVGLSIDTAPLERAVAMNGQSVPVVEGFRKIYSVDLVAEPAAGGGFNRLIAAQTLEEVAMPEIEKQVNQDAPAEKPVTGAPTPQPDFANQVRRLECKIELSEKLTAAKLPESIAAIVREAFEGRVFESADLDRMIKTAKEAQTKIDASGQPALVGGRVEVTFGERDKYEAAFLKAMAGNTTFRKLETMGDMVKDRLPAGYQAWVKNGRQDIGAVYLREWTRNLLGGDPLVDQRAYEAVTQSDMASIIKNAVNVMLAANYQIRERWWEPIVRTEEVDTIDQATLVRVYGMSTLSVVSEGQTYQELSWGDDEETAAFVKKGNYVGITLETLMADKLNVVRSIPSILADTWYNTLSALVSGVFTCNSNTGPVMGTTGALFNATAVTSAGGHANLLTTALSYAALDAARLAMRKQTNMALGTGRRLLIQPRYLLVPADLETTANELANSDLVPNQSAATSGMAFQTANQYKGKITPIVVPDWSDTNNWALVADPAEHPAIYNIFLRGRSVPEIFTANSETEGAMFTNDTLRYKVRMMTWRYSATYDCAPVADFRPLHKSNV